MHPDYWIFEDITYVEIALSVFDVIRKQGQLLKENRVFQREHFFYLMSIPTPLPHPPPPPTTPSDKGSKYCQHYPLWSCIHVYMPLKLPNVTSVWK